MQAERLPVAADQPDRLVRQHPAQRAAAALAARGHQHQAGVAGQLAGGLAVQLAGVVQLLDVLGADLQLAHAGPAGIRRQLSPVLLGGQPDRGRLHPQWQVLADQHHVIAFRGQAARHRQDPGVVVAEPEPRRQHRGVRVVQLDADRAALVTDGQVGIQPAVLNPQVIQVPEGLPGEIPQLWMMPLGLKLGDDHDGQDHPVLGEPADRGRVGEQDAGVQHVAEPPGLGVYQGRVVGSVSAEPRSATGRRTGHSFSPGRRDRRRARTQKCLRDRDLPSQGRVPALRSSRLRARTRSSSMSRAFPGWAARHRPPDIEGTRTWRPPEDPAGVSRTTRPRGLPAAVAVDGVRRKRRFQEPKRRRRSE